MEQKFEITITIKEKSAPKTKATPKVQNTTVTKALADCSWEEIRQICKSGEHAKLFRVGDKKDIKLIDGEILTVAIAGFDHDVDGNDRIVPITFTSVNVLEDGCTMTDMSDFLSHLYENRLPEDVKNAITPVKKDGEAVPFFLHSEMEIFGKTEYSNDKTGKQYPYYKEKCHRCKFRNSSEWTAYWWERSAYYNYSSYFCCVGTGGGAGTNDAGISFAVAPAFGIG